MRTGMTIVVGCVPTSSDYTTVRETVWSLALDQRAFGPRKLLVAFADADGRFRGLAFTARKEPLEMAFDACLAYLGDGAAAAVPFCDEPVTQIGPPPTGCYDRFDGMRDLAARRGIRLIDWIACDDDAFRSARFGHDDDSEWWDITQDRVVAVDELVLR